MASARQARLWLKWAAIVLIVVIAHPAPRCAATVADRSARLVIPPITEGGAEGTGGRPAWIGALGDRLAATSGAQVRLSGEALLRDNGVRARV